MPWISRGLRHGIVTSGYPKRADGYDTGFRGAVTLSDQDHTAEDLERAPGVCPTNAISVSRGALTLDQGSCVLCGRCVALFPTVFHFSSNFEASTLRRSTLVVAHAPVDDGELARVRGELATRVRALRRSVHVRHVDAGSDGSDEWEVAALTNPLYDVQRLGIYFTASPRHADVLLVTGVGSIGMHGALKLTYDAMPHPKVVVAVGVDAISGGLVGQSYASSGGVESSVPVDVFVPGSPPTPFGILHGLLVAVNILVPHNNESVHDAERS